MASVMRQEPMVRGYNAVLAADVLGLASTGIPLNGGTRASIVVTNDATSAGAIITLTLSIAPTGADFVANATNYAGAGIAPGASVRIDLANLVGQRMRLVALGAAIGTATVSCEVAP